MPIVLPSQPASIPSGPFTGRLGTVLSRPGNIVPGFGAATVRPVFTAVYDAGNDRSVLSLHSPNSGYTDGSIEFSDDGLAWAFVSGGADVPVYPGTTTIYDYQPPAGRTRYYRARVFDSGQNFFSDYSTASVTAPFSGPPGGGYSLTNPVTGFTVSPHVVKGSLLTYFPEQFTEHRALGRSTALITADVLGAEDGEISFWTMDVNEEASLLILLKSQTTLILAAPDGRQWYIRIVGPRNTAAPYGAVRGGYREHRVEWRGQPPPP